MIFKLNCVKASVMKIPQPIPYQGSKRAQASLIINFFPKKVSRLVEPFAGSAAISIAAAAKKKANRFLINDINSPLINLMNQIVSNPKEIADEYALLWNEQLGREKEYYLKIRELFNQTKRSDYFLYVLARCVKGAVRYNANGEFNQSADNRRKGKRPEVMRRNLARFSELLRDKSEFISEDYREAFERVTIDDVIYMDPPYQGTSKNKDPRYINGVEFSEFVENLEFLNRKKVRYLISYDGKMGDKKYGDDLPEDLNLKKVLIKVGRSTTSTLLGKSEITYESLYISEALALSLEFDIPKFASLKPTQLELL